MAHEEKKRFRLQGQRAEEAVASDPLLQDMDITVRYHEEYQTWEGGFHCPCFEFTLDGKAVFKMYLNYTNGRTVQWTDTSPSLASEYKYQQHGCKNALKPDGYFGRLACHVLHIMSGVITFEEMLREGEGLGLRGGNSYSVGWHYASRWDRKRLNELLKPSVRSAYDEGIIRTAKQIIAALDKADVENMTAKQIMDLISSFDGGAHSGASWSCVRHYVHNNSSSSWVKYFVTDREWRQL